MITTFYPITTENTSIAVATTTTTTAFSTSSSPTQQTEQQAIMLTHSTPPACRFMYSPGMGNGNYSGNPIQSYNYFPIDFNMPPSLLFRSGQHEIQTADSNSAAAAAAAAAVQYSSGTTPLDYSGGISASSQSVHTSMESINGGEEISSVISPQSSPEYMSPDYSSAQQQQQQRSNQQQQQYYQQTSMQVDETVGAWNNSGLMQQQQQQQQMSLCEPTTIEMELMKKDSAMCSISAAKQLNKKLQQKIKCEHSKQSSEHSIGMNIVILFPFLLFIFSVFIYSNSKQWRVSEREIFPYRPSAG